MAKASPESKEQAAKQSPPEIKPTAAVPKRLYRSRSDRMIAGVAGGMAEYFGMDSSLMRLIFVLLVLLPGIGIIAYIIAWIVMPENPADVKIPEKTVADSTTPEAASSPPQRVIGLILIAVGGFFLLRAFIDFHQFAKLWPLILVIIGLVVLFGRGKRE